MARRQLVGAALLVLCGVHTAAEPAAAGLGCALTPERAAAKAALLAAALEREYGYSVHVGFLEWFLPFDGQGPENPDGSYGEFSFQRDVFPERFCDVNGETCDNELDDATGLTQSLTMGPSDALVFLGCTPPPAKYFAFDMLVSSRFFSQLPTQRAEDGDDDFGDYWWPGCPFNDAHSQLRIFNDARAGGEGMWNAPLAQTITFNNRTAADVAAALAAVAPTLHRSTYELSADLVNLYPDKSADFFDVRPDSFRPLLRWSMPDAPHDSDDVQDYYGKKWPILLVSRAAPSAQDEHLFRPSVTDRTGTFSEPDDFEASVASTIDAVGAKMAAAYGLVPITSVQVNNYLEGQVDDFAEVLVNPDLGGDYLNTLDAVYGNPDGTFPVPGGGMAACVGVRHTELGHAAYNNAGIGAITPQGDLVSQFVNSVEMESCKSEFTDNEGLFVLLFRWPETEMGCAEGDSCCFFLPEATDFSPMERTYLNPQTKTGPAYDGVLGLTCASFGPEGWAAKEGAAAAPQRSTSSYCTNTACSEAQIAADVASISRFSAASVALLPNGTLALCDAASTTCAWDGNPLEFSASAEKASGAVAEPLLFANCGVTVGAFRRLVAADGGVRAAAYLARAVTEYGLSSFQLDLEPSCWASSASECEWPLRADAEAYARWVDVVASSIRDANGAALSVAVGGFPGAQCASAAEYAMCTRGWQRECAQDALNVTVCNCCAFTEWFSPDLVCGLDADTTVVNMDTYADAPFNVSFFEEATEWYTRRGCATAGMSAGLLVEAAADADEAETVLAAVEAAGYPRVDYWVNAWPVGRVWAGALERFLAGRRR